jgi:2-dehydro-3-deoxyphosphogluconate aldolase/(4S)-4-hydroxy-2-oxoglutarate aldolase
MPNKTDALLSLLAGQPVIPVIKIEEVEKAVPLARALAKGGLRAIEITLRTPAALDAIRRVAAEVEEAIVGAGTILNPKQFDEAAKAGSEPAFGRRRQRGAAASRCDNAGRDDDGARCRARFSKVLSG